MKKLTTKIKQLITGKDIEISNMKRVALDIYQGSCLRFYFIKKNTVFRSIYLLIQSDTFSCIHTK